MLTPRNGAPLAALALLLVLTVLSCGQSQQQAPGGQTVLPSAGQSESAPPGDVPAPATQPQPYP